MVIGEVFKGGLFTGGGARGWFLIEVGLEDYGVIGDDFSLGDWVRCLRLGLWWGSLLEF